VFYTDWDGAEVGLNTRQRKRLGERYRRKSGYVLGGLAARFGGLWAPHPEEVTQPLRAYVYTVSEIDAAGADPAVARAVGVMGLGLAAQTGGVCVDLFGFNVREAADLVIRPSSRFCRWAPVWSVI
jgi:hypothetical protein